MSTKEQDRQIREWALEVFFNIESSICRVCRYSDCCNEECDKCRDNESLIEKVLITDTDKLYQMATDLENETI